MSVQPALPGVAAPAPVGGALGAVYTPDSLALALVRHIAPRIPSKPVVLEPNVGGGAFVRAARKALRPGWVIGVDVDPDAAGLALCDARHVGDWPTYFDDHQPRADVLLANPPFGDAVGLRVTIEHVRASIECGRVALVVLPLAFLCGSTFDAAVWSWRAPAEVVRITSRPWPDRLREAVALVWDQAHTGPTMVGTVGWAP